MKQKTKDLKWNWDTNLFHLSLSLSYYSLSLKMGQSSCGTQIIESKVKLFAIF